MNTELFYIQDLDIPEGGRASWWGKDSIGNCDFPLHAQQYSRAEASQLVRERPNQRAAWPVSYVMDLMNVDFREDGSVDQAALDGDYMVTLPMVSPSPAVSPLVGVALRDYFVGVALQGLLASGEFPTRSATLAAAVACDYADAVMAAREKK